jgi:hypothetical protein
MKPILDAVNAATAPPATAIIRHADLILLNRDHHQYEWTTYAKVLLGQA